MLRTTAARLVAKSKNFAEKLFWLQSLKKSWTSLYENYDEYFYRYAFSSSFFQWSSFPPANPLIPHFFGKLAV